MVTFKKNFLLQFRNYFYLTLYLKFNVTRNNLLKGKIAKLMLNVKCQTSVLDPEVNL